MEQKHKYGLGYALSGGGAKGFAHAGVIAAFEEAGLFPEIVSGTSAGAIFGSLYGIGFSPKDIFDLFMSKEMTDFAKLIVPKSSLFNNSKLRSFFNKHLGEGSFESLRFPFVVVATDLDNGRAEYFSTGDLINPVMASCCVPLVFPPILINGVHYVDGGLFCNFPVSPIRDLCETIIGVNVNPLVSAKYKQSMLHIAERTYHIMSLSNTVEDRLRCDVLVEVYGATDTGMFEIKKMDKMFKIGYEAGQKAVQEHSTLLKPYFNNYKKE